jgi:4-amino-4-deoxy-L-arabinose transferase-like glycosyltransferase
MKRTKKGFAKNSRETGSLNHEIFHPETKKYNFIFTLINKENIFYTSILFLSAFLYLFFSLSHLGKFLYTDEPVLWLFKWIPEYWDAYKYDTWSDFAKTLSYPAIPTLFFGGLFSHYIDFTTINYSNFHEYLFLIKAPVVIFNFLTLFLIFGFVKKLTDKNYALLVTGLIALHPLVIAFSQHTQGDTTLWNTFILALVCFLLYMKFGKKIYLLPTSFFFALAVLSKFPGLLLYPLLFIILYSEYLFGNISKQKFKEYFGGLMLVYMGFSFFILLFFPTCRDSFSFFLKNTYFHYTIQSIKYIFPLIMILLSCEVFLGGKISNFLRQKINFKKTGTILLGSLFLVAFIFTLFNSYSTEKLFTIKSTKKFGGVLVDDFFSSLYLSFDTFTRLMPWFFFLGLFAFAILSALKKQKLEYNYTFYILLITLSYFIGSALGNFQMWVKYQIFLIPVFILFFATITFSVIKRHKKIFISALLLLSTAEVIASYPNYFFYRNRFIPLQWGHNIKADGNYGGFELAQLANKMPNADTMKVLSDTYGFNYFFRGQSDVIRKYTFGKDLNNYDYLFLSSFGRTEKTAWHMVGNYLDYYYRQPLDSAEYSIGDEKGWVKLVKIDKKRITKSLPNAYNPMYFIDFAKPFSLSFIIEYYESIEDNPFFISVEENKGLQIKLKKTENEQMVLAFEYKVSGRGVETNPLKNGQVHHIVWYQTGGNIGDEYGVYCDGKLVEKSKTTIRKSELVKFYISTKFKGNIGDVRIYDFALKPEQVEKIYNKGKFSDQSVLQINGEFIYPVQHYSKK